ncbi:MAG: hypothetical protein WCI51_22680, partial [Lentisphaerota bacterium]
MNYSNLILLQTDTPASAEADVEGLNTLKALRTFAGLPLTDDALYRISGTPPILLTDPVELTMAMIVARFRWLCSDCRKVEFSLSSHALLTLVEELDMLPKRLGFYHREVLRRECSMLVPKKMDERTQLWQLLVPIQRWRTNFLYLNCPMLGTALLLSLMHRLIRAEKSLSTADWTPLIMAVALAPVNQLAIAVNDAVLAIIEKS